MKQQELNKQLLDFAEELLEDNHQLSFSMRGNSMYPALKSGDVGIVEKCSITDIQIGDIIVFKQNGELVAHRLVKIIVNDGTHLLVAKVQL